MSLVVSGEILAGVLIVLVLAALLYIFVRRRLLSSGAPLMLCALRPHGGTQYRLGLLRFSGNALEWFTLVGPSPRPARTWERPLLQLGPPRPPASPIAGLPEAVTVECRYRADTFEVALAPAAYTAMRSWLESSPPGFNVNVA